MGGGRAWRQRKGMNRDQGMLQELLVPSGKSILDEFLEFVQPEHIILIGFGCHVFMQEGDDINFDSFDFQIL